MISDIEVSCIRHCGHIIFEAFKKRPHFISQIDAATGQKVTYEEILTKSVSLAKCLRAINLKSGDVLAIGGRNHLDIYTPFYAAMFNGFPIVGVDPYYKYSEILALFKIAKPKVAFCQEQSYNDYVEVAKELGLNTRVFTFDDSDHSLANFIAEFDDKIPTDLFKVAEFDIDDIFVFLISTSGTTGKIKVAAFKHKPFITKIYLYLKYRNDDVESNKIFLNLAPVNWVSSYFAGLMAPLAGLCNLMSSISDDLSQVIHMINKYKPASTLFSPSLVAYLISRREDVDLTCFKNISVAGSKNNEKVYAELQALVGKDVPNELYGLTEAIGPFLMSTSRSPVGSVGKVMLFYSVKLADVDNETEINETDVPGELWVKGLLFSEYYNDPEATAAAISEDGFLKTGDILYRDDQNYYFFVDRKKSLIKYRNFAVIPSELESIIRTHPAVADVSVIGIPDPTDGERPVACVIRKNDSTVTAQEIKDLVAGNMSKNKQLHGGVLFLEKFPLTSTGKVTKVKLLEVVLNSQRE